MLELGFTELSMEPVVCAPGDEAELTMEDLPVVLREYERLAEMMLLFRSFSILRAYKTSCFTTSQFISGSPPKKSTSRFVRFPYEPLADRFKERSGNIVKALCLHVAHTCNLNCSYCFASQGKYHGVMDFLSPVQTKDNIAHLTVGKFNNIIVN